MTDLLPSSDKGDTEVRKGEEVSELLYPKSIFDY